MFKSTEERIPCTKGDIVRNKKTKEEYTIYHSSYNSSTGEFIESSLWQNIKINNDNVVLVGISGNLYNKDYQLKYKGKWVSRK
ncbi:hypothetical protein OAA15_00740 [bacterium]|nr:hypothetical protein [bacterium]